MAPDIKAFLKSIPSNLLADQYYQFKHPGAIYNQTIGSVSEKIIKLIEELPNKEPDKIVNAYKLVLHDFFQFYDACYQIIICCCNKHAPPKKGEFFHQWLKRNGYSAGVEFYNLTSNKVVELKDLHNLLKHTSLNLQTIEISNRTSVTFGLFLDKPYHDTPIIPKSLSLQLQNLHYLLYFISDSLYTVLKKHFLEIHKTTINVHDPNIEAVTFQKLFDAVHTLPPFYLLNEIGHYVYNAVLINGKIKFLRTKITESLFDDYFAEGIHISMVATADGYTNRVHIPYCGMLPEATPGGMILYYHASSGEKKLIPILIKKHATP